MDEHRDRLAWIERTAPLLFGERWVAPLSRALAVDQSLIHRWRTGERLVQEHHVRQLAELARERVRAIEAALDTLPEPT